MLSAVINVCFYYTETSDIFLLSITRCKEQLNWDLHLRTHLSGQETCCLNIGFRHVSSASGCASSGARHVTFGQRKGNLIMCICSVGLYSTTNCGQTVCARSDLGRPKFQASWFLTHAFCTAVLILDFDKNWVSNMFYFAVYLYIYMT